LGIIIKQSLSNTIISYVGIILGFITTIWLYPNILDPEQYGLIRVIISLSLLSTQFTTLGIKNTIVRYFPYFKDQDNNHNGILGIALLVPLFGFIIYSGLFVLFKNYLIQFYSDKSNLFQDYYFYIIPLILLISFFETLSNYARALYHTVFTQFSKEIFIRSLTIAILVLYFFQWINFSQFIIFFIISYALQLLSVIGYLYLVGEFHLSLNWSLISGELFHEMMIYSFFSFMGGITTMIVGNIDIIMLGALTNLNNAAIYFIAFSVGTIIEIPKRSIHKVSMPLVADYFKTNRLKEIENLYKRISINQIVIGLLLLIGIWANLPNLFKILPKNYYSGALVIVTIALAKLFDMATGINGGIIVTSKYFKFDLISNIFLIIISIITNYYLIPIYGIFGAALATAISLILYNIMRFIFVWIKLKMQPFTIKIIPLVIISTIILIPNFYFNISSNPYIDTLLRSILITISYSTVIIYFNISKDINNIYKTYLQKLFKLIFSSR